MGEIAWARSHGRQEGCSVARRYVLSTPHAPAVAREIVREALEGRFRQSVVDDAEVVASELMTMLFQRGARGLSLSTAHDGYRACIDVRADELGPRPTGAELVPEPSSDQLTENILRALTTDWGFELERAGAAAWAIIDA
jgi:hypothetical protein